MAAPAVQVPQPPSWPTVIQAHRGWLSSVVYARLHDQHAVEEVLQETALAASRQVQVAEDPQGVCRWLYRVAIRQAMLYRRRQVRYAKRVHNAGMVAGRSEAQSERDPYQILLATERAELVQVALRALPAKDCEVLMLKYRDGWSCREMANRLQVSESAMKSRLLRARNNLRQELVKLSEYWEES